MIINIRGTHGSGKSTLVRAVMQEVNASSLVVFGNGIVNPLGPAKRPDGYLVHYGTEARLGVVGPYTTACGGCDAIKTQDEVCTRVTEIAGQATHTLFEGAVVSTIFGRYGMLANTLAPQHKFVFAFLDTPIEVCLARVEQRRREAGNEKELNPKNTVDKVKSIAATRTKLEEVGLPTITLHWETAQAELLELLK